METSSEAPLPPGAFARERLLSVLALGLLGFAGVAMKGGGSGPVAHWCRAHGAGVCYEASWLMALRAGWPRARIVRQALAVFAATALLEAAQLWRPPVLEAVRRTFAGRALLGASFDWLDYPHYAVGCALGAALACWVRRPTRDRGNRPAGDMSALEE